MLNKKVKWLVEVVHDPIHGRIEEITPGLTAKLMHLGYTVREFVYNPMTRDQNFHKYYDKDDCVVFYGGIHMAQRVRREAAWIPGVLGTFDNYDMLHLMGSDLEPHALNRNGEFLPFGKFVDSYDECVDKFGLDIFIRPNGGEKQFSGCIFPEHDDSVDFTYLKSKCRQSDLVYISRKKWINFEYRLVISNKKIVAGSLYMCGHDLETEASSSIPSGVLVNVEKILDITDWVPDDIFVMDVYHNSLLNRTAIIELNMISTSGLYACDLGKTITAMSEQALSEWEYMNEI